ncbi:MAG: hypothetical protein NXH96_18850 [Alteromonadaceae bacterium]|nr:hypothetical protein [Alteromonadaceae bacterium]
MKIFFPVLLIFVSQVVLASEKCLGSANRWQSVMIDVAAIPEISLEFRRSVWGAQVGENQYESPESVLVSGDATEPLENYEFIHICGDSLSDIFLTDHSELVIAGDVKRHSKIHVDGISRIFVGGSMAGTVKSKSSLKLYIRGDFTGLIETGSPTTKVEVKGDFSGAIKPNGDNGALLTIDVKGFTDIDTIKRIYESEYTELIGAFEKSNVAPGIYPVSPLRSYYVIRKEAL